MRKFTFSIFILVGFALGIFYVASRTPQRIPVAPIINVGVQKVEAQVIRDVPGMRDYNVTKDILPDAVQANIHGAWVNYLGDSGFEKIDTEFVETENGFEVTKAPFKALAPFRSTGTAVMHNDSKLVVVEGEKEEVNEAPLDQTITPENVNDVAGQIQIVDVGDGEQNAIVYEGAYDFADLIYFVDRTPSPTWKKIIRFNEDPRGNPSYTGEVSFIVNYDAQIRLVRPNKVGWGESADLTHEGALNGELRGKISLRGISFEPFKIWDSDNKVQEIQVKIKSLKKFEGYELTKIIPDEFFDTAVFPVYTDTTSTFSPAAGANSPVDASTAWAVSDAVGVSISSARTQNGTNPSPDGNNDTQTAASCGRVVATDGTPGVNTYKQIFRCHFLFNTASIGAGQTISSSSIAIFQNNKIDQLGGTGTATIILTNPASNSSIAAADHQSVTKTRQSSDVDITGVVDGAYMYFNLNSTGLSNISNSGITKFAVTNGFDIDITPTWNTSEASGVNLSFVDDTNDPVLTVVYATTTVPSVSGGYIIQM